ncbi:MAG: hypothetical protein AAGK66_10285, partial [Pseudomonadota bacterium]
FPFMSPEKFGFNERQPLLQKIDGDHYNYFIPGSQQSGISYFRAYDFNQGFAIVKKSPDLGFQIIDKAEQLISFLEFEDITFIESRGSLLIFKGRSKNELEFKEYQIIQLPDGSFDIKMFDAC